MSGCRGRNQRGWDKGKPQNNSSKLLVLNLFLAVQLFCELFAFAQFRLSACGSEPSDRGPGLTLLFEEARGPDIVIIDDRKAIQKKL